MAYSNFYTEAPYLDMTEEGESTEYVSKELTSSADEKKPTNMPLQSGNSLEKLINLNASGILQGIVFSEILGKPRSRKGR